MSRIGDTLFTMASICILWAYSPAPGWVFFVLVAARVFLNYWHDLLRENSLARKDERIEKFSDES